MKQQISQSHISACARAAPHAFAAAGKQIGGG